jgi:TIR domain/SIR2-like domain
MPGHGDIRPFSGGASCAVTLTCARRTEQLATVLDVTEECWDDILGHLRERVLVAFVGPELVTMEHAGRRATVSRVLAEQLAEHYKLAFEWTDSSGLPDVVRALLAARGRSDSERLYRVVNDLLLSANPTPPEALGQLASILDIRLFVTTTFDSLMTQASDAVRFGGAHGTRELWFAPNQSTVDQQKNARPPGAEDTVVFKLFGRASSTPQYALHDEDMLEWLHALLAETAGLPEWLEYQLRESPLLFIGCRIPDWMGRFLVRLASSTRLSLATKQFFIVGSTNAREPGLADFLKTYCGATHVQMVDADPAAFVAELHQRWRVRNAKPEAHAAAVAPAAGPHGTIFISYAHEDAAAARAMCDAITALGGDVWLDERRLEPGDRWEEEILGGIRREVQLFVPLISKNTEMRAEGYVFREWGEALKRSEAILHRRFIVPVVIDTGYDGNPGKYQQLQEGLRAFQFGYAPEGQPDANLRAALTEEIRAMRRKEVA